jgi:hypothetical protein
VGLTYQTEFNSFGQFIKNIFSKKEKRQAAKQAEEQAIIDGGKTVINIGDEAEVEAEAEAVDGISENQNYE